jgi:hypothetical protein
MVSRPERRYRWSERCTDPLFLSGRRIGGIASQPTALAARLVIPAKPVLAKSGRGNPRQLVVVGYGSFARLAFRSVGAQHAAPLRPQARECLFCLPLGSPILSFPRKRESTQACSWRARQLRQALGVLNGRSPLRPYDPRCQGAPRGPPLGPVNPVVPAKPGIQAVETRPAPDPPAARSELAYLTFQKLPYSQASVMTFAPGL